MVFIVYPQAVTTLPAPPLWAILFFGMLITLGLDTQFALIETLVTCTIDSFNVLRPFKIIVLFVLCVVMYLLNLMMATPGGLYVLQLMDDYSAGWNVLFMGLIECAALWCYGNWKNCFEHAVWRSFLLYFRSSKVCGRYRDNDWGYRSWLSAMANCKMVVHCLLGCLCTYTVAGWS